MTDKNKISDILKKNQLFKGLSKKELQSIVSDNRSSLVKYSPREVIYTDKSFKKALGAVISGSVSVFRVGNGSRVLLNKIDETGIFGAASLFGAEEQFVTEITALTESEIFFVPAELCEEIISQNSTFALSYIRFLSDRIRFLNRRISELSASGTERKFAKYLLDCKETPSPNMKQLASFLGIGRASLYRLIDSFSEDGLIQKNGKNLIIKDYEGLKKLI